MTFLSPIAASIAAGITVPALIALYFLKRRRRLMAISSTLLWRKALQDLQVNAPFQRIRRSLLLLLQLLLLAGLLLAFAQPTTSGKVDAGQRTVIVIDHSASMNATDVERSSRLVSAKVMALDLIEGVGEGASAEGVGGGGAMIISIARRARVVQPFTTDRSLLRQAVKSIGRTDEESRLGPALQLIEPFAAKRAADDTDPAIIVHVLSDGRMHDAEAKLTIRGVDLRFRRIGSDDPDNLAIVALAARRDVDQPQTVRVFVRLANYGPDEVETNLTLRVDGEVVNVAAVAVPPLRAAADAGQPSVPGSEAVQFDLVVPGSALIEAAHDHEDALKVDNRGYLNIAPQRRLRVLLVSATGNAFLTRAIKAAGADLVEQRSPATYESGASKASAGGVDVVVFDRYSPRTIPAVAGLYFNAAPPVEGLSVIRDEADAETPRPVLHWQRNHPLLSHVALDDLVLANPGRLALPDAAQMLAAADIGPVMATVEADRRRHVIVAFDLLKTNWPMQVSFPVFVSNVLQWLSTDGQSTSGPGYRPGQVAVIPLPDDVDRVSYTGPVTLTAEAVAGRAVLPAFTRVGLYEAAGTVPEPWDKLPVNLTDARESDLRPTDHLQVGTEAVAATNATSALIRREIWRWFIWVALALLMIEWVVYTRRMSV